MSSILLAMYDGIAAISAVARSWAGWIEAACYAKAQKSNER